MPWGRILSLGGVEKDLAISVMPSPSPIGPPVITSIRLVERYRRGLAGKSFTTSSLPGHLIHLVVAGRAEQTSNGRRQTLSPGTLVWYHEDEWVEGRVLKAPWIFYSVNFTAPALAPPDFETRFRRGCQHLGTLFERLREAWHGPDSSRRAFLCQSRLLALLGALEASAPAAESPASPAGPWWEIEAWARRNIGGTVSLADICDQFRLSPKTVERACHAALGQPPMKRVKSIRLSLARGLARFSELSMTEIATRVGYARVHEFSRDYRKAFGLAPPWSGSPGGGNKRPP